MCRFFHAGSVAALLLCLASCASVPPPPPVVMLGKEDITVAGRRVRTVDEMLAVLSEKDMPSVALRTQPDVPYERVGTVIYAIFRAGGKVSDVDGAAAP